MTNYESNYTWVAAHIKIAIELTIKDDTKAEIPPYRLYF